MINFPPSVRIFLAVQPTDMRRGFDGLAALTTSVIGQDPLSGHLFVFCNRRRDRMKILYWDRDGFALWMKRLERGTFSLPAAAGARVEMTTAELAALLAGIDLNAARRRVRYSRPTAFLQNSEKIAPTVDHALT
jgi:transposase